MTDKPTPESRPAVSTMTAKLKGDGPIELTEDEANELRTTLRAVFARDNQLLLRLAQLEATNQVNICMAEALQKQGFQVVREQNPDGTVGWNLQNKPQPATETVN